MSIMPVLPGHSGRSRAAVPLLAALRMLAAVFCPLECAGCGLRGSLLCPACAHPFTAAARLARPAPVPRGLPAARTVAAYDGLVRTVLGRHKEAGRLGLTRPLGFALATAVEAVVESAEDQGLAADGRLGRGVEYALVPVPSRRGALRRRGHDPVRGLVRQAAAELRIRGHRVVVLPVLRHARSVRDQAGLTAAERADNLAGALRMPARFRHLVAERLVVVADDIITTGATLTEAARAVTVAGGQVVGAATVAATPRRLSVCSLREGADLRKVAT